VACHAMDWHPRACHGVATLRGVLQLPDIDPASPVPPYRQVAAILADAISSGAYAPGARLPSITDLGQRYGIARRTASKALAVLVADGMAEYSDGMGHYVRGHE
jgi:DNA-binding GntR family transcriptional regulator